MAKIAAELKNILFRTPVCQANGLRLNDEKDFLGDELVSVRFVIEHSLVIISILDI